jgi:hypothetical protein
VCANLFFAIINLEMSLHGKKRDWFDLGAKAYSQACPGIYAAPTYLCPICRKPFTVEALYDGRLSKEHVPPQSVGGHDLLLTCAACNNTAGTKLDASAKTNDDVRLATKGGPDLVNLPSLGDMTFYDRLANNGLSPTVQHTTYEYVGWPTTPTFGLLRNEAT